MSESKQVSVGGQLRTIEKFSTRKMTRALKVVGDVARAWKAVNDEIFAFQEEYSRTHPRRLTRDGAAMRIIELQGAVAAIREEADAPTLDDETRTALERRIREAERLVLEYRRLLDGPLKDQAAIETPGQPSTEETMMAVAPHAFEHAEDEVTRLLGLALMTNREIGDAHRAGTLDDEMARVGGEAMDTSSIDEALEVLLAAGEMLVGDLQRRRETVGKILALFRPAQAEERQEAPPSPSPTSLTPTGVTSSPVPTDGDSSTPSTSSPSPTPVG